MIDSNDTLTYSTAGNIKREQGAIEFWVRPNWDGADGQTHFLFEAGSGWFNRILVLKDGANNLRFLMWDSANEYGAGCGVGHWKSGEWHHVAATWSETQLWLYVDGELRNHGAAKPPDAIGTLLSIGASVESRDRQANALIDEFRISDIARVGNSDTSRYRVLVADSGNNEVGLHSGDCACATALL